MKKNIYIIILATIFLFGCKKNTSSTSGKSGGAQSEGGMTISKFFLYKNGAGLSQYSKSAEAHFFIQNVFISPPHLFANGRELHSYSGYYQDSSITFPITPTTWSVTGNSLIPSFSYTNNDSIPKYTGYALIPDTIYKNQINTIHINGVSGADEIGINIVSLTDYSEVNVIKDTSVTLNNVLTLSPSDFTNQGFSTTCDSVGVNVEFYKINKQVINGHNFTFSTHLGITKYVYLK